MYYALEISFKQYRSSMLIQTERLVHDCQICCQYVIHFGLVVVLVDQAAFVATVEKSHSLTAIRLLSSSSLHLALNVVELEKIEKNRHWPCKVWQRILLEVSQQRLRLISMLDGDATYKHTITDFKMTGNPTTINNTTTYNSIATVSLKAWPATNVSISIKLMDDSAVRIWVNPSKSENHFGNIPIYGAQRRIA
jgi:hypothetical protein